MIAPIFRTAFSFLRQAHKRERGQVLVLVVVLMSILCGMSAIAIDLGSYSADRRDLQNAADAIALAAAQDLPSQDAATAAANSWAVKNDVAVSEMALTFTPQGGGEANPKVQVTLTQPHNFTFARAIGITSTNVSASATAIRTSHGNVQGGGGGLMPWSILESIKNSAAPGNSVVLKYDSNNVTNGNFGALRVDGNGANIYRDSIEYGTDNGLCAAGVTGCTDPSVVQTQTGNMVGSTRTGTNYRIDNNDPACNTWAQTVNVVGGKHQLKPECNPFVAGGNPASLRIIIVPVISSLCNGACNVTVTEFALFFLEGYGAGGCTGNNCEIKGKFINSNTNLGATSGTFDSDPSTSHFVRLIQ